MKVVSIFAVLSLFASPSSQAWDGFDYEEGAYIEIDEGNLVREGEEIEYFDYEDAEYKYATVEAMDGTGFGVELEIYDYDTGETRTFDMD